MSTFLPYVLPLILCNHIYTTIIHLQWLLWRLQMTNMLLNPSHMLALIFQTSLQCSSSTYSPSLLEHFLLLPCMMPQSVGCSLGLCMLEYPRLQSLNLLTFLFLPFCSCSYLSDHPSQRWVHSNGLNRFQCSPNGYLLDNGFQCPSTPIALNAIYKPIVPKYLFPAQTSPDSCIQLHL